VSELGEREAIVARRKAWIILTAILVASPYSVQAQSNDKFTASSLYALCSHSVKDANTPQDHEFLEKTCTTYLLGLTDALFVMQSLASQGTRTCLPTEEAIGIQEARTTFEAYLREHPATATNSAGLVAAMSLVYAHKCR
jgi:hypothetical protein